MCPTLNHNGQFVTNAAPKVQARRDVASTKSESSRSHRLTHLSITGLSAVSAVMKDKKAYVTDRLSPQTDLLFGLIINTFESRLLIAQRGPKRMCRHLAGNRRVRFRVAHHEFNSLQMRAIVAPLHLFPTNLCRAVLTNQPEASKAIAFLRKTNTVHFRERPVTNSPNASPKRTGKSAKFRGALPLALSFSLKATGETTNHHRLSNRVGNALLLPAPTGTQFRP